MTRLSRISVVFSSLYRRIVSCVSILNTLKQVLISDIIECVFLYNYNVIIFINIFNNDIRVSQSGCCLPGSHSSQPMTLLHSLDFGHFSQAVTHINDERFTREHVNMANSTYNDPKRRKISIAYVG